MAELTEDFTLHSIHLPTSNQTFSLSILLPTLNETFSFAQTIDIILDECDISDICEFIAIVCERTEQASLKVIEGSKTKSEALGVPLNIIWQKLPYAGGAVRDGISAALGSHILMMAPDLETDPHAVKDFIKEIKKYPNDMIIASRWLSHKSFEGYNSVKLVCNKIFQIIFALLYGTKLSDMTFGYRCAATSLFQSIAWEEVKHPFFLETLLKPLRLKVKIHEIPTTWKAREEGESQNSFWATFKYFGIAIRTRFKPALEFQKK